MQTQIPLFRAQKEDSEEWIEGYLQKIGDRYLFAEECYFGFIRHYIKTSTLAISFDNRNTWFDMENAERAFAEYMKTHGYEGIQNENK